MILYSDIVKELVEEIAGRDVVDLVEYIKGKEDVSEFKIAEKLKLTVNQARNMLYRLYSHNLVSFTRKKDKKKGWYIYYWTFDEKKAYNLFLKLKRDKLKHLKQRLESESKGNYFSCSNEGCNNVRMSFESAMEHDFKCPDCGKVLQQEDNTKRINVIEREIDDINKKLEVQFVETPKKQARKRTQRKKAKKTPKKAIPKKRAVKRKIVRKKPPRKMAVKKTVSKRKKTVKHQRRKR